MRPSMEVRERRDGERVTLVVSGEIDIESSPRLREAIRRGLGNSSVLAIDLRDVPYIDSSGIATLIQGYKHALRDGVEFRLVEPSSQVMAVIELSHLHTFFTVERSEGGG